MKQTLCDITVLLDRSGSMESIKTDVEGGFNRFVIDQAKAPGECLLTLVQFDTVSIDTVHTAVKIGDVPALVLEPRGGTPLLDALGRTIVVTGERLKAIPEADRPGKVLFLVVTDGQENSSREYTKDRIRQMVEEQENKWKWEFSYLGANVNAFAESGAMGFKAQKVSNFTPDAAGVHGAFAAAGVSARAFRSAPMGASYGYSDEQREEMGSEPAPADSKATPKP